MANVTAQGTIWNLPNYAGELFTAKQTTTFLRMIGGLGGFSRIVESAKFPMGSEVSTGTETQPDISETQSLTAANYIDMHTRSQAYNVVQTFMKSFYISYQKMAERGTMSGLNLAGDANNAPSEVDFQVAQALAAMARQVEYTFLNGTYEAATDAASANRTRGIITACTTNTVAAGGAALSKTLFNELLREMYTNGADFENAVIFVNGFNKEKLSDIFLYAPQDRTTGGGNIERVYTNYGEMGVVLCANVPAATLLVADMSKVRGVGMNVPGKGNFFLEELAKSGASQNYQLYGNAGIDYTSDIFHGTITGLATA